MNKKHLFEQSSSPLKQLKDNRLAGVLFVFDRINKNGRVYPRSEALLAFHSLKRQLESKAKIVGALDHPSEQDSEKLTNASHILEAVSWDEPNKCVRGIVKLLPTRAGQDALALIKSGVPVGISTRGTGSLVRKGTALEVQNWKIETVDLVSNPSSNEFMELCEAAKNSDMGYDSWLEEKLLESMLTNKGVSVADIERILG